MKLKLKSLFVLMGVLLLTLPSCNESSNIPAKTYEEYDRQQAEINKAQKIKFSHVDFHGEGVEPKWFLDLDFEGNFTFESDVDSLVFPAVLESKAQDANARNYYTEIDGGSIALELIKSGCKENLEGLTMNFSVNVHIIQNGKERNYEGCGYYIPNYRLHDIWALEQILIPESNELKKIDPPKTVLEIHLNKKEILGELICNSFMGGLWLQGRNIQFSNISVTEIYCERLKFLSEGEVISTLQSVNNYEVVEGKLYLYQGDQILMVYRKVD